MSFVFGSFIDFVENLNRLLYKFYCICNEVAVFA